MFYDKKHDKILRKYEIGLAETRINFRRKNGRLKWRTLENSKKNESIIYQFMQDEEESSGQYSYDDDESYDKYDYRSQSSKGDNHGLNDHALKSILRVNTAPTDNKDKINLEIRS